MADTCTNFPLKCTDAQLCVAGECIEDPCEGITCGSTAYCLGGECLDLHRWHESLERLIANALQPEAVAEVILHPAQHWAVVVVKANQALQARGRRGENRELASRLCGWQIEIRVFIGERIRRCCFEKRLLCDGGAILQ